MNLFFQEFAPGIDRSAPVQETEVGPLSNVFFRVFLPQIMVGNGMKSLKPHDKYYCSCRIKSIGIYVYPEEMYWVLTKFIKFCMMPTYPTLVGYVGGGLDE